MVLLEVFSSVLLTISQIMDVPPQYQVPLAILAAVLVCLILFGAGLSIQKSSSGGSSPKKTVTMKAPRTPGTPPSKKSESLGTVSTPAGRRSARLASRRKED